MTNEQKIEQLKKLVRDAYRKLELGPTWCKDATELFQQLNADDDNPKHPSQCPDCGRYKTTVIVGKPDFASESDCVLSNAIMFNMSCDACHTTWVSRFSFAELLNIRQ